jgi:hypothetical protein
MSMDKVYRVIQRAAGNVRSRALRMVIAPGIRTTLELPHIIATF